MCLCIYIYIFVCGFQKCIKLTAWCIVANAPCFIHMNNYDCVRLSCFCALFHVSRAFARCFFKHKMYTESSYGSPNTSTHVGCKSVRLSANFATFCTIEAWFPSWEFKGIPPQFQPQGNKALWRGYETPLSHNRVVLGPYFLGGGGIEGVSLDALDHRVVEPALVRSWFDENPFRSGVL